MNLASVLLYPLMLLFPAAGGSDRGKDDAPPPAAEAAQPDSPGYAMDADDDPAGALADWPEEWRNGEDRGVLRVFAFPRPGADRAWQVRIEQRMTIRITPRVPLPVEPGGPESLVEGSGSPRYIERKIGKCLPIAGIAGVQPDGQHNLLLFMRDRRIVSAELERACRAGSFYSGFLLSRSSDGQMCVGRDTLLSRSGSNCKLTRLRQLVATGR